MFIIFGRWYFKFEYWVDINVFMQPRGIVQKMHKNEYQHSISIYTIIECSSKKVLPTDYCVVYSYFNHVMIFNK